MHFNQFIFEANEIGHSSLFVLPENVIGISRNLKKQHKGGGQAILGELALCLVGAWREKE